MTSNTLTLPSAGGIPGLEGDDYDDSQDLLEDSNDIVRECSLYVHVAKSPFLGKSLDDIARGLEASNDSESLPDFLNLFVRKEILFAKMTFSSKTLRDSVFAKNNINFNGISVTLELPRSDGGLTIYLDAIPLQASHSFVSDWLQSNFGAQLVEGTLVKFVDVPGCTKIRSTTRSAVVRLPAGRTIPGYALMRSKLGEIAKIRIRYKNSGIWCRKCFGKGHMVGKCTSGSWVKSTTGAAGATTASKPPQKATKPKVVFGAPMPPMFSPSKPFQPPVPPEHGPPAPVGETSSAPPPPVPDWSKAVETSTSEPFNDGFPKGILDREYPNREDYIGFYGSRDYLSNFFPAEFYIDGKLFHSIEHYVVFQKAQHYNFPNAIAEIELAKDKPFKLAKIGNLIPSDSDFPTKSWRWHWDANCAKFEQNPSLLIELFNTKDNRLVYCSKDLFWGCGLERKYNNWCDKNNWTGQNVLGDLLTHLRRQLRSDPKHRDNVVATSKRKPTSPMGGQKYSKNDGIQDDDFVDT